MVMQLNVRSNVKQFAKGLDRIQKRQLPFATANALNRTAFAVRRRWIGRTFPQAFTLRNKRFPSAALRVEKASKRRLQAAVFDHLGRGNLLLHAEGGVKRAKRGRLAIPSSLIRRTKAGRVAKAQKPRALRQRADVIVRRLRRAEPAIWQRTRRGLRLLYSLKQSARIRRRLRAAEDADRVALRAFPGIFAKSLARALATARR